MWGLYHRPATLLWISRIWSTLTEFTMGIGVRLSFPVLRAHHPYMTSLKTLSLESHIYRCHERPSLFWPTTNPNPSTFPVTLSNLSSLTLVQCDNISVVLRAMSLPALPSLRLTVGMSPKAMVTWSAFEALFALVRHSGCRVSKLSYYDHYEGGMIYGLKGQRAAASAFPHLQHLAVESAFGSKFCE